LQREVVKSKKNNGCEDEEMRDTAWVRGSSTRRSVSLERREEDSNSADEISRRETLAVDVNFTVKKMTTAT
jgi:hypothetical protein